MERLIESVHNYPCIWNTESQEYKLQEHKDAAWLEVVKQCDLPDVKEAKALWRKLRDGHRQAIARKKTLSQQGIPKSTWKYEKQMEFLLPTMKTRPRTTYFETQESSQYRDESTEQNDGTQQNDDPFESVQDQSSGSFFIPPNKINVLPLLNKEQRQIRCAKRDSQRCYVTKSTSHALKKFFTSMMLTTSQLPERMQLRVQRQIFNTVMEAKEETLNQSASSSTNTLYHLPGHSRPIRTDSPHSYSSSSNYSDVHTQSVSPSPQIEMIKSECYDNQMLE